MNIQRSFCLTIVVACGMLGAVQAQQSQGKAQLTLSRALAMVGGARKEAKLSEIRIYRQKAGNQQEILKVDYAAIKKNKAADVFLKPYDVIDVSDTGFFDPNVWWKNVINALTGGLQRG